jgi:hypothetical protein
MNKIIIFYWEPGSCGDFINSLFLSRPDEYKSTLEKTSTTGQGRVSPTISQFFVNQFDHVAGQWYRKDWTVRDCELISNYVDNINNDHFVIPTHRLDQVDFLQSQFVNCCTLGITYPTNMFPLILKNWCKKVAPTDKLISEIYNKASHQYLRTKNSFGELFLRDQLTYGTNVKTCVNTSFDVEILLEDLYCGSLATVKSLFKDNSHVDLQFEQWIEKQNIIHRYRYNIPPILQQALGYNSKAEQDNNLDVELDTFDNILIKHYFSEKNIPNFNTLQQAADFFNKCVENR